MSYSFHKKFDIVWIGKILAGEISESFAQVLKFGLKCIELTLLSAISLVISIFKELSHNFFFFLFLGNLNLDVPGGGRHPGTKQVLRLPPEGKNVINENQKIIFNS